MKRIRVHHYERDGLLWRPHIEIEPGVFRIVQEVAQPTGQEAFVASVEREVLFSGPRGTGKTRSLSHTFLAHLGAGYGNAWRGVLLRRHLTGFTTLEDMLRDVIIP